MYNSAASRPTSNSALLAIIVEFGIGGKTNRWSLVVTIASQLRIQSILSPTEPEADELSNASSNRSTSKRKLENFFAAPEAASSASDQAHLPKGRADAGGVGPFGGRAHEPSDMIHPLTRDGKKTSKLKQPMRSSIACLRCRRSKIKCDNDGGYSPCDTCIKGGHQCQYPETTILPPKRAEPSTSNKQLKDGSHERKRPRKTDEGVGLDSEKSVAYAEEILTYPFLTTELWDQLLGIYKQNYATELSFIHMPTLKDKMSRRQGQNHEHSSELNLVLLGVLTLTARFHPDLVKYVAHLASSQGGNVRPRTLQSKPDPVAASEYFANALTTALGPLRTALSVITVERIQAFLMLGLFEWSHRHVFHGSGAWMYIGVAIRMAELLKLGLDDQLGKALEGRSVAPYDSRRKSSEIGIVRESRRRTMYSCLVLDRLMACGSDRSMSIPVESIRIQLPCSEMAFDLALDVQTGFLKPPEESSLRQINDDSTLSRFIQLMEIWGDITRYSSTGGRLRESVPPWDNRSTFCGLREKLDRFLMDLPDTFTLSRQNYYRHDNHQATNTYVSLHMLASMCQIVLDREYMPYLPLRCCGPQGPFGEQSTTRSQAPDRFWEDSADNAFRAARDIIDLVEICKDKLPQTSLIAFSVWLAGFMATYAHHFPLMDVQRRIISPEDTTQYRNQKFEAKTAGAAHQALHKLATYLPEAQNYSTHLEEMSQYFKEARSQFDRQYGNIDPIPERSFGSRRLSIRLGDDVGIDAGRLHRERHKTCYFLTGDERRSPQDEGSDVSQDSSWEPFYPMAPPGSHQRGLRLAHGHSTSPTVSFAAMDSPSGGGFDSVGLSSVSELRREGLFFKGNQPGDPTKTIASLSKSQLLLPGVNDELSQTSIPEFSMERLETIESRRIGEVLNDLEAFSGAGSLGAGPP
ncbi:hypothetical protein FZEAL_4110 [Fusarium zealandicum]|uniref:Zn(2)-C6 fungal-type domain-containing protein n=1 Tax=Fusarium zealandicum TaxID=1053134 RepID=A0A8H4XL51_9HYPO|nr:hypothetical protein FZEAL_4110 [Fusarium zealandicum]